MFTVCRNGDKKHEKKKPSLQLEKNKAETVFKHAYRVVLHPPGNISSSSSISPFYVRFALIYHRFLHTPRCHWLSGWQAGRSNSLSQGRRMHLTRALASAPVHSAALFEWYTFETRPISGTRPTPWALLAALLVNSCWALCMMAWGRFFVRALGLQEVSVEVALLAEHATLFKCGWIRL